MAAVSAIAVNPHQHGYYNNNNNNNQNYNNHAAPVAASPVILKKSYDEPPPQPAHYIFEYSIQDGSTGDVKTQHETRNGDRVEGYYTLVEPDGHRRIVHYTADDVHGFQARVEREEIKGYVAPQPQVQAKYVVPTVSTYKHVAPTPAPVVKYVTAAAPSQAAYVAPIARVSHYVAPTQPSQQHVRYTAQVPTQVVQKVAVHQPKIEYSQVHAPIAYNAVHPVEHHHQSHVKFESPLANYVY